MLPYRWSDDIALSFRLFGWDGQDFDVDGTAWVTYHAFPDSNCCHLINMVWREVIINNQKLSAGEVAKWSSKYVNELKDHVECLLQLLHPWQEV